MDMQAFLRILNWSFLTVVGSLVGWRVLKAVVTLVDVFYKRLQDCREELHAFGQAPLQLHQIKNSLLQVQQFVITLREDTYAADTSHVMQLQPPPTTNSAATFGKILTLSDLVQQLLTKVEAQNNQQAAIARKLTQATPELVLVQRICTEEFSNGKLTGELQGLRESADALSHEVRRLTDTLALRTSEGLHGAVATPGDLFYLRLSLPPVAPWEEDPLEECQDLDTLAIAATQVLRRQTCHSDRA